MGKLDIALRFAPRSASLNPVNGDILVSVSICGLRSDRTILSQTCKIKSDKGILDCSDIPFPPSRIVIRFFVFRCTMAGSPIVVSVFGFRGSPVSIGHLVGRSGAIGILGNRNQIQELGIIVLISQIGTGRIVSQGILIVSARIGDIFPACRLIFCCSGPDFSVDRNKLGIIIVDFLGFIRRIGMESDNRSIVSRIGISLGKPRKELIGFIDVGIDNLIVLADNKFSTGEAIIMI